MSFQARIFWGSNSGNVSLTEWCVFLFAIKKVKVFWNDLSRKFRSKWLKWKLTEDELQKQNKYVNRIVYRLNVWNDVPTTASGIQMRISNACASICSITIKRAWHALASRLNEFSYWVWRATLWAYIKIINNAIIFYELSFQPFTCEICGSDHFKLMVWYMALCVLSIPFKRINKKIVWRMKRELWTRQ